MKRKIKPRNLFSAVIAVVLSIILIGVSMPQSMQAFADGIRGASERTENDEADSSEKAFLDGDVYAPDNLHEEAYDKAEIVAEDITRRTATSKTFVQADGTFVFQDYGTAVHYLSGGEFVEIDNTIDEAFKNKANAFSVEFDDGSKEAIVKLTDEKGSVSLTPL
ncbi:MAG: hypothetical protein LBS99_05870 [Clostridiales bacterium]|jgi:hypothetical protein|nr:hypothetical protein [Clostridiales bacterium]